MSLMNKVLLAAVLALGGAYLGKVTICPAPPGTVYFNKTSWSTLAPFHTRSACNVSAQITTVARTSDVATLTTAGAHGFTTGNVLTVNVVTNTSLNGEITITSTPTTTSFTYASTGSNISSTSDTGNALPRKRRNSNTFEMELP